MRSATKLALVAILAAISLGGLLASARADDQTTPEVAAPTSETPEVTPEPAAPAPEPMTVRETAEADKDKWVFTSPLLFWFPALKGSVSARGQSADVDLDMGDIANHTDVGFVGFFDLTKDKFGVYLQPNYLKISGNGHSPSSGDTLGLDVQLWIVEMAAHYKFWEWQGDYPGSLMAVGGLRFWQINSQLKDKVTKAEAGDTKSLWDPIVGLRYQQYYTKNFHIWLQGDIGGFGLGQDTSRFAWQVWPLVGYDFIMPVIKKPSTFFAGYRLLDMQRTTGNQANDNAFHLLFHGVTVGMNVILF
jgi:hypothetical protein